MRKIRGEGRDKKVNLRKTTIWGEIYIPTFNVICVTLTYHVFFKKYLLLFNFNNKNPKLGVQAHVKANVSLKKLCHNPIFLSQSVVVDIKTFI